MLFLFSELTWLSSTMLTEPSLSKKTSLNLSPPADEQETMTPLSRSFWLTVMRKKCACWRSTVPAIDWPKSRCCTIGRVKPGVAPANPDWRCRAAIKTFWVISVGTGIPALVTRAPKSRPIAPSSSTRTLPSSTALPSSPCWQKKDFFSL